MKDYTKHRIENEKNRIKEELAACIILKGGLNLLNKIGNQTLDEVLSMCLPNGIKFEAYLPELRKKEKEDVGDFF